MPALNFQERFADPVETNAKRQTIRRVWKRPIKPGDTLYLYRGMRTKRCRRLRVETCLDVQPIMLHVGHHVLMTGEYGGVDTLDRFARKDGFDSWPEMRDWFKKKYGLPFEGVLITW